MLASVALIGALLAPGEIYRCKDAAGAVSYQDHPCATHAAESKIVAGGDSAASQLELQRWLDGYRQRAGSSMPRQSIRTPESVVAHTGGVISESQLAICSERFLHCAHGDAATMDRCVDRLPRCGASAGACCPQACVDRYQALRASGEPLATSVRLALLDPNAPACGAAGAR
jgi:hypothetical protein